MDRSLDNLDSYYRDVEGLPFRSSLIGHKLAHAVLGFDDPKPRPSPNYTITLSTPLHLDIEEICFELTRVHPLRTMLMTSRKPDGSNEIVALVAVHVGLLRKAELVGLPLPKTFSDSVYEHTRGSVFRVTVPTGPSVGAKTSIFAPAIAWAKRVKHFAPAEGFVKTRLDVGAPKI